MTAIAPHDPCLGDPMQALDGVFRLTRRLTDDLHVNIDFGEVRGGWPFAYDAPTRALTIRKDAPIGLVLRALQQTFNLLVIGPEACDGVRMEPIISLVPSPRTAD